MICIKTNIEGVFIIEPKVFGDSRAYFFESFSQREFDEKVTPILGHRLNVVQGNESMSTYGVMCPAIPQSKLVRCVKGAMLVFAVLGVDWKISQQEAVLSEKDINNSILEFFDTPFSLEVNYNSIS